MNCRFCGSELTLSFIDLGISPLSNAYLKKESLNCMESFYPLHEFVCERCYLVQLPQVETPEHIFTDYKYFSSYSESWLKHVESYVERMVERFGFDANHQIVEIASNDGYLLQYFEKKGIPVLGVEPAKNVAEVAEERGIATMTKFFGVETAEELVAQNTGADLLIGNNVLAHVPDLNDFIAGMKIVLRQIGIITMEFPHLLQLMNENQFDTIYHEHFSYFSLLAVERIFSHHGLTIFDVDELSTHGGSLRIYVRHSEKKDPTRSEAVNNLRQRELNAGLHKAETYAAFASQVELTKQKLLTFLIKAKQDSKTVVGYGAPAKGNTLLNYCGIRTDFLDYTVDRSTHKQNHFLPGTHIPIYHPDKLRETKPDYVLILPWNLKDEIMSQIAYIREWGGQFVLPIPEVPVYA